jgi:hypothetical protein
MAKTAKRKKYKLPTPPAGLMRRGIPGESIEEKWRNWHKGIPNAPAFPSPEQIARQWDRLNSVGIETINSEESTS